MGREGAMGRQWADPKEWAASMTDRPAECRKHPGAVQLLVGQSPNG